MTRIRRILVPTDFSACAATALDHAVAMAKGFAAEIVLLHVIAVPANYTPFPLVPLPGEWLRAMRDDARARLDKERGRIVGVPAESEVRDGRPDEGILAVAAEGNCDLIVMGTHGWSGLKHAMLGSVAERVVRRATVPVLTIRGRE